MSGLLNKANKLLEVLCDASRQKEVKEGEYLIACPDAKGDYTEVVTCGDYKTAVKLRDSLPEKDRFPFMQPIGLLINSSIPKN